MRIRGRMLWAMLPALLAAGLLGAGLPAPVLGQQPAPQSRSFDYWQPDWMMRELWGPDRMSKGMKVRMLRHITYMNAGVPETYSSARSTVPVDVETITTGAQLFGKMCASCHGKNGMGEGDPGNALSPSPALLAYMIRRPIAVDEYLLWAISDGGKAFESEMPAFKDKLSREEIWKIVAYMRAGFPTDGTR